MTIDYAKIGVNQIREMIVEDSNGLITAEDAANIKPKSKLVACHQALVDKTEQEAEFEDTVLVPPETIGKMQVKFVENEDLEVEAIPLRTSPDWPEYVMSQFEDNELVEDKNGKRNPNIVGLRRLTNLLVGDVIESGPSQIWPSTDPNGPGRATVLYKVIISNPNDEWTREFSATASSWHGNTDDEFAVHPEAIAETRAEGRALRKALGIANVSAEELTNKNTEEIVESYVERTNEEVSDDLIQDAQKGVITTMCNRLGIDIMKFINSGNGKYQYINDIPRTKAVAMIKKLNHFQSSENGSANIPEEIKIGD